MFVKGLSSKFFFFSSKSLNSKELKIRLFDLY